MYVCMHVCKLCVCFFLNISLYIVCMYVCICYFGVLHAKYYLKSFVTDKMFCVRLCTNMAMRL